MNIHTTILKSPKNPTQNPATKNPTWFRRAATNKGVSLAKVAPLRSAPANRGIGPSPSDWGSELGFGRLDSGWSHFFGSHGDEHGHFRLGFHGVHSNHGKNCVFFQWHGKIQPWSFQNGYGKKLAWTSKALPGFGYGNENGDLYIFILMIHVSII